MYIKVGRSLVLGVIYVLIKDTPISEKFKYGEARRSFWTSFKRSQKFPKQCKPKRIELARAK